MQAKYINHLDSKLSDVAASVQALEVKFDRLETFVTQKLDAFGARMDAFAINQDLKIERAINTNMRGSIG